MLNRDAVVAFFMCLASDCFLRWAPKGTTGIAVDFKPRLLAEVRVLSCGRGRTLGRMTTSVNEESEQTAGQDKYLSAGHLPHLSSSPAAWLVPPLGQCLPLATGPAGSS